MQDCDLNGVCFVWETCFGFGSCGLAPHTAAMHLCGQGACTKCFVSWMGANHLHLSCGDIDYGQSSVESLHLPSFLQPRQLPLTVALSWDALDITTCLSLFFFLNRRTAEARVVHFAFAWLLNPFLPRTPQGRQSQ